MCSIQILICHHHDTTIAQVLRIGILLALLQSQDFLNSCKLFVLVELDLADILDVEHLTLQGEDTPLLTTHYLETTDS